MNKRIILFGANYSLIFALKFLQNDQSVDVVCTDEERKKLKKKFVIEYNGAKNKKKINIIKYKKIKFISQKNQLSKSYSICFLGMPQVAYSSINIKTILKILIKQKVPMVSIMNLPPLKFIKKIKFFKRVKLNKFYGESILNKINYKYLTHASTEPQIKKHSHTISVNHIGKLRIAKFNHVRNDKILNKIVDTFNKNNKKNDINLSMKIYSSSFVPLSKLPMLICGNYRCYDGKYFYTIKQAVMKNINESKIIYNEVYNLLIQIGAKKSELIPFRLYYKSIKTLNNLSSIANNIKKQKKIERIDVLVQHSLTKIKKFSKLLSKINKVYDRYENCK